MLPKIVVGSFGERNDFLVRESIVESNLLSIDGFETDIKSLREWINFCSNVVGDDGEYPMVIWNAGKLSFECQNTLLKPLEEKKVLTKLYLMVEKESDLLETILSRCETEFLLKKNEVDIYWKELVVVWRGTPGNILSFSEKFDLDKLETMLNEIIIKIKVELTKTVNIKRLGVLKIAFEVLTDIERSNVNKKMALESFLFRSWKAIKA